MHLSLPKRFFLFILASSVCWSLQCLISALTQGGDRGHFFKDHLFSCSVGREEHCKQITLACAHSVLATLGLATLMACVCFPCLHCVGSRLLCRELYEASPGLYALPRSKPLRFTYSSTPQRHRLGWACVLRPFQVQAAQVTRCLASTVAVTYRLPCPCRSVFWVYNWHTFSGGCQPSRIPRSLG